VDRNGSEENVTGTSMIRIGKSVVRMRQV